MTQPTHSLSIDIGGTFTDFTLVDLESGDLRVHKVLTNADDPAQGLLDGVAELLEEAGASVSDLQVIVHSTTLATNSIIERKGANIALLTTEGFRDILEMGREQIYDMHDLHAQFPNPIVPRRLRREISERTSRDGDVFSAPQSGQTEAIVDELVGEGVDAVAISLLHSYKNPANEQTLRQQIAEKYPDLAVSVSSEVAPVINEYERTSTTVADGYIKPTVSRYVRRVEQELERQGYPGRLLVMHSAGGVMDANAARQRPIRMLESGPAAGALAASFYSKLLNEPDLISLDMGGTTAKTCVIEDGSPTQSNNIEVARVHRFKKGSGLPILIPVLDLIEIGSGGGSIARVDNLGLLQVGPQSAGASPGPACYGLGGVDPTVTDANLLLGYLNPDYFLGGRMGLDAEAAGRALAELGETMGMSGVEAAWGIYSVVTESMAAAARIHIIERNRDPRNYALVAFGGAGPAHAGEVARILGAGRVIVPLGAGVTSALGCLAAPLSFENVRSMPGLFERTDWASASQVFDEMEVWGREMLVNAGVPAGEVTLSRSADVRLVGQIHEINVPIPEGELDGSQSEGIEDEFHRIYQELYSRKNLSIPIEVQNWRSLVSGPQPYLQLRKETVQPNADAGVAQNGSRSAYFPGANGFVDCPVFDRYRLPAGCRIAGPAIVEEEESTTVIRPADSATVDQWLNLVIEIGA